MPKALAIADSVWMGLIVPTMMEATRPLSGTTDLPARSANKSVEVTVVLSERLSR